VSGRLAGRCDAARTLDPRKGDMGLISTRSPGGDALSQSGEPASFLSFSLAECGGGIRADEAGLLGVEGAGPQPAAHAARMSRSVQECPDARS
jgi:hypothetical protein